MLCANPANHSASRDKSGPGAPGSGQFDVARRAARPDAVPLARGTDVATVDADGRLVRVTGFLDAT